MAYHPQDQTHIFQCMPTPSIKELSQCFQVLAGLICKQVGEVSRNGTWAKDVFLLACVQIDKQTDCSKLHFPAYAEMCNKEWPQDYILQKHITKITKVRRL